MTPARPAPLLPLALFLTVTLTAWWAGLAWRDLGALRLPTAEDMLRLAQLRDWLDGQAFGDMVQQRLGPPGGTEMGGSRLPDLVPGIIIRLLAPVLGVTRAEIAAVIFWPEILLLCHLLLTGALARRLGSPGSAYAAIAIAAIGFPAIAFFEPGRIAPAGLAILVMEAAALALVARRAVWAGLAAVVGLALMLGGPWPGEASLFAQPAGRVIGWTALPLVGLIWSAVLATRTREPRAMLFAGLIAATLIASVWRFELAALAAAFAAPALAQLIVAAGRRGVAWQVGAWLVSAGLVWQVASELLLATPVRGGAVCTDRDTLSALDRLDTGAFAAPDELSAYVVGGTTHRALAGPAPKNGQGNRAAAELFRASPEEARYQASLWSVDYIALCPDATGGLPRALLKPGGLADHLLAGAPPAWLDPVPLVGSDLLVWRVQPVAAPGLRP